MSTPPKIATIRSCKHQRAGFVVWTVAFEEYGVTNLRKMGNQGLLGLIGRGYAIADPQHLIDLYGPRQLRTDDNHVARDDRDSALGEP